MAIRYNFKQLPVTEKVNELCSKADNLNDGFSVWKESGPRLNIKIVLSTYGDFHVKDKTAVRTSYL